MSPTAPIHFVHSRLGEMAPALDGALPVDPDAQPEWFRSGVNVWILQTYLELRARGWDVRLVDRPVSGTICVMHSDDFVRRLPHDQLARSFNVVALADRGPVPLADLLIVQNPLQADGRRRHMINHWPQPGLIPRDPARGNRVENILYPGHLEWLDEAFRSQGFQQALAALGMRLVAERERWWDCRDADVILAVRRAHPSVLRTKPASKLFNAWRAGVPALLGPEPAFQTLRQDPLDYLEVRTPEEALAALRRFRDEPEFYRLMRDHGVLRANAFSRQRVAEEWETLLRGPVLHAHKAWQRRGVWRSALRRRAFASLGPRAGAIWDAFALRAGTLTPGELLAMNPRSRTSRLLVTAHRLIHRRQREATRPWNGRCIGISNPSSVGRSASA